MASNAVASDAHDVKLGGCVTFPESSDEEILIDDSGWGDLILGVVIGVLRRPSGDYMERRIPVIFFQPPRFERKEYLDKAVDVIKEAIDVMRPLRNAVFRVCSGYVLSGVRKYLREQGFSVKVTKVIGELQERVERGYLNWCREVGVPSRVLQLESGENRFWALLNWVKEKPELREGLVKTGWKSWREKWRDFVYET